MNCTSLIQIIYRGKAATWLYGKLLTSYNNTSFTYDANGRRITKGNITYTYDNDGRLLKSSNGLEFIYDNTGVVGVKYSGNQYFYRKDAQGNIIAILDSTGKVVVKYVYDAWGNHAIVDDNGDDVTSGIGVLNPFRYRGYYYDTETELYYLQSRYYDPDTGRFISQDSIEYADPETINGLNLYAYCGNNPVSNQDFSGCFTVTNSFALDLLFSSFEIGIGSGLAIVAHAIKTAVRPNNIGIGIFKQQQAARIGSLTKASAILSKVSTVLAVISVVISVYDGVQSDISRGYTTDRIISNAVTNTVVYGSSVLLTGYFGSLIGSAIGSAIPGLGNVIGAAAGFLIGVGIGFLLDLKIGGKSIIDHIDDAVYNFWKWLFG